MCLFCDIASGKIPSRKVYEDDKVLAFLDLNPVNPGHTLLIPKKHFDNFMDIDEENAVALSKAIVRVTKTLKEKLHIESLNIINNSGEIAGQTVMHCHVHIIPRSNNDPLTIKINDHEVSSKELDDTLIKLTK